MKNPAIDTRWNMNIFLDCITKASKECFSVLELGCMFGDKIALTTCPLKIGIDAHKPYLDKAIEDFGHQIVFLNEEACSFVERVLPNTFDAVMMIDFLEHLTPEDAETLLSRVQSIARKFRS